MYNIISGHTQTEMEDCGRIITACFRSRPHIPLCKAGMLPGLFVKNVYTKILCFKNILVHDLTFKQIYVT